MRRSNQKGYHLNAGKILRKAKCVQAQIAKCYPPGFRGPCFPQISHLSKILLAKCFSDLEQLRVDGVVQIDKLHNIHLLLGPVLPVDLILLVF